MCGGEADSVRPTSQETSIGAEEANRPLPTRGTHRFAVCLHEPVRAMFSSFVAALDIALVFMIFKGDVRLT